MKPDCKTGQNHFQESLSMFIEQINGLWAEGSLLVLIRKHFVYMVDNQITKKQCEVIFGFKEMTYVILFYIFRYIGACFAIFQVLLLAIYKISNCLVPSCILIKQIV